jgi:hypothetical protein
MIIKNNNCEYYRVKSASNQTLDRKIDVNAVAHFMNSKPFLAQE